MALDIRYSIFGLRSRSGSALYYVVAFVSFAFIATVVFMAGEHYRAMPMLRKPADLQALLNARSGVWKTIEFLSDSVQADTSTINALDSTFTNGAFGTDTINKPRPFEQLITADGATEMPIFETDSFGGCTVSVAADPVFVTVESRGGYRQAAHAVTARIGGTAYFSPDTVVFLDGQCPRGGRVSGQCVGGVSQSADLQDRFAMRPKDLTTLMARLEEKLAFPSGDSTDKAPPLTIQAQADFEKLPEVVEGPLFVDGNLHELQWRSDTTQYILGDLQFTGEAIVENIRFVVAGSVKIFDKTIMRHVSVVAKNEIHIGDKAQFSGTAIAGAKIVIYGRAEVLGRSVLVTTGSAKPQKPAGAKPQEPFSIFVSEDCAVDGVLLALGIPGAIKTDERSVVKGILWAQGQICHRGQLLGVLKAQAAVDCDVTVAPTPAPAGRTQQGKPTGPAPILVENIINGKIGPLDEIDRYRLPFFVGQYAVAEWRER